MRICVCCLDKLKSVKSILPFILLSLFWSGIAAAHCENIRLDLNSSMAQVPVFDQAGPDWNQDTNICYAAAAAQLVDAYRLQKSPGLKLQLISPWWVATNYSSIYKKNEVGLEFGEIARALEAVKMKGVCSQEDLFENQKPEKVIHFYHLLKEFFSKHPFEKKAEASEGSNQPLTALLTDSDFIKDPVQASEISERARNAKSFNSFIESIFSDKCSGKIATEDAFNFQRIEFKNKPQSRSQRAKLINETLQSSQPLEASICSQMFRQSNYQGVSARGAFTADCLRHSVMLVGSRKLSDNRCQYLVRDMYGADSCHRTMQGKPWYNPQLECSGGQLWISQNLLLNNTWGLTRIAAPVPKL